MLGVLKFILCMVFVTIMLAIEGIAKFCGEWWWSLGFEWKNRNYKEPERVASPADKEPKP